MKIEGIEHMNAEELDRKLSEGAKFLIYQYSISCGVASTKKISKVFFLTSGESKIKPGLLYSLISCLLGWWGIPWGPIYTIGAIMTNFRGGIEVTNEVVQQLRGRHGDLSDVHIIL